MDLLKGLNPSQQEAVEAVQGPVLVLAGPGSGKTRVLTHRVASLVLRHGVFASHIMAVTFTNKAAREMRDRLKDLIGDEVLRLAIGTFHANCARILRRDGEAIGLASNFNIYDTDDQLGLVKQALKEQNVDDKKHTPRSILAAISAAKSELVSPETYQPKNYPQEVAGRIYTRYEALLRANDGLDFDDLLMKTVVLFSRRPEVLDRYQERYTYILVDEFQDTNTAQYELVRLIAAKYRNVFVVGDEDQSIYSWRGADYRNVERFRKDYPDARVILLEQNYRSTQAILDAANAVISRNLQRTRKTLRTDRSGGAKIWSIETYNESEEAKFVVDEIERLVTTGAAKRGEVAVMYRTNAQSRALEDAFVWRGKPYRLVGATRFYERKEIKDVLAYLRLIHNPNDNVSLARVINVPTRGIGASTLADLSAFAARHGVSIFEALRSIRADQADIALSTRGRKSALSFLQIVEGLVDVRDKIRVMDLMDQVLEQSGYAAAIKDGTPEGAERWENIEELRNVAAQYEFVPVDSSLDVFLEEISLVSDVDNLPEVLDAPTLLTLHAAKGLEFGTVFMVGMNEGLLPHTRAVKALEEERDETQMEEERRLCYVGITRAKDRLYLLRAFRRTQYGRTEFSEPSRFLADIPAALLRDDARQASARAPEREVHTFGVQSRLVDRKAAIQSYVRDNEPSAPEREPRRAPEPVRSASARPAAGAYRQLFHTGDAVVHAAFGDGTVIQSVVKDGDEEVTVAFKGRGVKRLMASFANLRKVKGG